jgi:CNT family concentrative nucleoside transporter
MDEARLQALLGIVVLPAIAWLLSEDRRAVDWRRAAIALLATILLAASMLHIPGARAVFAFLSHGVDALGAATRAGTSFVFGYLGGGPLPFEPRFPGGEFVLAFQALPLVIVASAISALLFHWRILPAVVRAFGRVLERALGVGGAVGVSTAANIFLGMVEAPLFIRPYLAALSRGELFVVMAGGMAGVAGTVMVLYAAILGSAVEGALGHILAASVAGAPAAILFARIMVPDREDRRTGAALSADEGRAGSAMDAIARGAASGIELLVGIVAMLIALVALVHLANAMLGALPDVAGAPLALERILGAAMAPVCWLMGVPWPEAATAGRLMGTKTVLNEFLAYLELARTPPEALSPRSRTIMLYALCGFANLGSVGIMIGGISAMCPGRRAEIAALGMKALVAGTFCTCLLGAIVGAIL